MSKQKIKVEINYPLNWEWGVEISKIRHDLDELEKLGATHVDITHGEAYGSSYVEISGYTRRLETDEEYEIRVKEQALYAERIKLQELEQLEKLKQKYPNL